MDTAVDPRFSMMVVKRLQHEAFPMPSRVLEPENWVPVTLERVHIGAVSDSRRAVAPERFRYSLTVTLENEGTTAKITTIDPPNFDSLDGWSFEFTFDTTYNKIETADGDFVLRTRPQFGRSKRVVVPADLAVHVMPPTVEVPPVGPDVGSW